MRAQQPWRLRDAPWRQRLPRQRRQLQPNAPDPRPSSWPKRWRFDSKNQPRLAPPALPPPFCRSRARKNAESARSPHFSLLRASVESGYAGVRRFRSAGSAPAALVAPEDWPRVIAAEPVSRRGQPAKRAHRRALESPAPRRARTARHRWRGARHPKPRNSCCLPSRRGWEWH